jgi:uncharacterized protein
MDPFAEEFWQFTLQREFRLQRCADCGKFRWPPSAICDQCLSERYDWTAISGRGRLLSWVVFHRAYFEEYPAPHTAIAVELEEGPLFMSTPERIDPQDLHGGLALRVDWREAEDRFGPYRLPVFRPDR